MEVLTGLIPAVVNIIIDFVKSICIKVKNKAEKQKYLKLDIKNTIDQYNECKQKVDKNFKIDSVIKVKLRCIKTYFSKNRRLIELNEILLDENSYELIRFFYDNVSHINENIREHTIVFNKFKSQYIAAKLDLTDIQNFDLTKMSAFKGKLSGYNDLKDISMQVKKSIDSLDNNEIIKQLDDFCTKNKF